MREQDTNPYGAHRFHVTCDALPDLGFTDVRGLSVDVVVCEADDPAPARQERWDWHNWADRSTDEIPSRRRETRSPTLELRRGMTDEQALWEWLQKWVAGEIAPQDVRVCLLDGRGNPVRGWVCRAATPVRWTGPDLVADRVTVATEMLELTHDGIEAVTTLNECAVE